MAKVDYEKEIKRVATFGSVRPLKKGGRGIANDRLNPSSTCIPI